MSFVNVPIGVVFEYDIIKYVGKDPKRDRNN